MSGLGEDRIEYMCGMGAGVLSVLATFPINKLMFRQSLWGFDLSDAYRQLKLEGFGSLFRGCLPPVMIKSFTSSVMFGAYNQYHSMLVSNPISSPSMKANPLSCVFLASMMGGCTEALLTPFERVQMMLQDGRFNYQYRNTVDAMLKLRPYGLTEYYRGMSAVLLRNGPSTFLYFGFKDKVKEWLMPDNGLWQLTRRKEAARNFVSGATLGAFISTVFYPINVLRIQMMTQEVGSEHHGVWRTARNFYHERNGQLRLLFSGVQINLVRSFLYWGCMTVFSELLRDYLQSHSYNQ